LTEDLLGPVKDLPHDVTEKGRRISKGLAQTLVSMKDNIPRDNDGLKKMITTPTHPFTAAVLTGILLIAMDISGFGVFVLVTWTLGNLILNPIGWVLIPVVVAIAFHLKRYFEHDRLNHLRVKKQSLAIRLQRGEIDQPEFERLEKQLFSDYLSK